MFHNFVHLHARSEYSLDSGFFNLYDYVKFCYECGFGTSVITERFNLFSALKFYRMCFDFGIKPIIGCELFLESSNFGYSKIILLCKNYVGYKNLVSILFKSHLYNFRNGFPLVTYKLLHSMSDGLIAIGLSLESDIGQALLNNDFDEAVNLLDFWEKSFRNCYYLSLTRLGIPGEVSFLDRVLQFASFRKLSLIATNEVSFLRYDDVLSYRSKIAMFEENGSRLSVFYDKFLDNKYFKSFDEMKFLFSDLPNVIYNTCEIVKRCNLLFKFGFNYSPNIMFDSISAEDFLFNFSLKKVLLDKFFLKKIDISIYINRLKIELSVINNIGFANYFLITHDFIKWARDNDIFVGPGRGSGAGSLIAYLLSITGIDPIKNDLLFERFLNKDRISSPDFDVDFCIEGRDLIIDYIFNTYGIKNVSQIVTFGCMTIKSVIRDVGRVLGYSYIFVDKIVKLMSNNPGATLKTELVNNLKLRNEYDGSSDIQSIFNLGLKIEGVIKGVGKHAGGLIISSVELLGYLPLQYDDIEFNFISQFDKDDAESLGFAKFDFLGLKTLTIISNVVDTFLAYYSLCRNVFFEFDNFLFDDLATYSLLGRGDTLGIFQFESDGLKSILQKVQPDFFSDIISLIALYRPGPLQSGLLLSFTKRKTGEEKIDYINYVLVSILKETYGMIVYQEQVMLIAQIFANYSLSDADFLRIAMSKKKTKDMVSHLENFVYGASLSGFNRDVAELVFYLVDKFAGYGFNKAHSVGYALLAYHSSWLKANYNIIFLSSLFSSELDNNNDVDFYVDEFNYFNIDVFYPDINRSFFCFTIINEKSLLLGFGAINGLGRALISEIIFIRSVFGYYNSFFDFLYRMDMTLLTKKVLQSLVYSGVFDKLSNAKFKLVLVSNRLFDLYIKSEFIDIFLGESVIDKFFNYAIKDFYYILEYKNIEFFNSRCLLGDLLYKNSFNFYINDVLSINTLSYKSGIYFNEFFCGFVKSVVSISKLYYSVVLSGLYESKEIFVSSFIIKYKSDLLKVGKFVVACIYSVDNHFYDLFFEDFYFFRCTFAKYFDIHLSDCLISDSFLKNLLFIMCNNSVRGVTKVRLVYVNHDYSCLVSLFDDIKVTLHDDLIGDIIKFKEVKNTSIVYSFF